VTLPSASARSPVYVGAGSTASFASTFRFDLKTDLLVLQKNTVTGVITTLALSLDYTVADAGVGNPAGGNIVLTAGNLAAGQSLLILRRPPYTQLTDLSNQGTISPPSIEEALDVLDMQIQALADQLFTVPQGDAFQSGVVNYSLPAPLAGRQYHAYRCRRWQYPDASGHCSRISEWRRGRLAASGPGHSWSGLLADAGRADLSQYQRRKHLRRFALRYSLLCATHARSRRHGSR
jgi:hypothetical protein